MKILFFIDSLMAGGKERRLAELLKLLRTVSDVQFEIAVMNTQIHYDYVLDWGIRIHYLLRNSRKDLSVFTRFLKLCRDYKPDIVHCWDSMTAVYSVPTCRLLGIALINGMVVDTPVLKNIRNKHWLRARITFPFSRVIVGNSVAGLRAYKAPMGKSVCIYNGIDLGRFENLREPDSVLSEIFGSNKKGLFVIGMVAGFDKRKDFAMLINVAKRMTLQNSNVRFVLVGGGEDLERLKALVPDSLSSGIAFTGRSSDVESIINLFKVGVLLTNDKYHGEGISNSILEYMAMGKPVIATKGGGTGELVSDNCNGFLIDPGDEKALEDWLLRYVNDTDLIKTMGDKGKEIIEEKFTLQHMVNQYVKLYKRVLSGEKMGNPILNQ